jgi:hypothetical protein
MDRKMQVTSTKQITMQFYNNLIFEVTKDWRKLNLNSSINIFRVIKRRRMRWAGHGGNKKLIQIFGWKI